MMGVTHLTIGWTGVKQDIKQSTVCELSQPFYTSQGDGVKSSTEKQKNNIKSNFQVQLSSNITIYSRLVQQTVTAFYSQEQT